MQQQANCLLHDGKKIAFVPTMGYLHDGHLALMHEAEKYGDAVILSIFVNPAQFGPNEDLQAYPRDLDHDLELAASVGIDVVFAPEADKMYDQSHETYVNLEFLPRYLCGRSRQGHFRGVATILTKLFNIIKPHFALFGEKDYQQLVIIRRLAQNLNFDTQIIGVPTVREPNGLAVSSRNIYLSKEERNRALSLYRSIQLARERIAQGVRDAKQLIDEVSEVLSSYPDTKVDYVAVCNPETLQDIECVSGPSLLAMAVWIGGTRLIDNTILRP